MLRTLFALTLACAGTGTMATAQEALTDIHAPKVTMYATATCGYCAKARTYFAEHHVQYEERDIEKSEQAAAEWTAKCGIGTPLIQIGEAKINGFDQKRLEAELAKYPSTRG
jgi:glutaredoxin